MVRISIDTNDKTNKKAVLKCSICTGEQVAGFKDIHTGHFDEIMLIRDAFQEHSGRQLEIMR